MSDPTLNSAAILYGSLLPGQASKIVIEDTIQLRTEPVPVWQSAGQRFLRQQDVVRVFDPLHPRHLRKGLVIHIVGLRAPKKKLYEVLFDSSPEDSEQFSVDRLQTLGRVSPGDELWTENDHGIFRGCRSNSSDGRGQRLYCLSPEDNPEQINQYPLDQVYRI